MEYISQSIPPLDYIILEESTSISSHTNLFPQVKFQLGKRTKLLSSILVRLTLVLCLITIALLIFFLGYKKLHHTQTSLTTIIKHNKRYDVLWSFDDTADAVDSSQSGFVINNPFYNTGYVGKAISLNGLNQYVDTSLFINFSNRSFTVEVWVNWLDIYNFTFNGIFGQCSCDTTCTNKCLHLMIRDKMAYMGFYGNDLKGHTIIKNSTWTHLAFVYDYELPGQQIVYVNGLLDGRRVSVAYKGVKGDITIGRTDISTGADTGRCFTGLIDQLSLTLRAKTAGEILEDATLCAYYSFDLNSLADLGPNGLNGSAMDTEYVNGKVNQALQFSSPVAYFQARGFTALGTTNKAFSIVFWIHPIRVNASTIVYVSNSANSWCLSFIGFTINGAIAAQIKSDNNTIVTTLGPTLQIKTWKHIAITYSLFNGQRIYIDGYMYSSSTKNISYIASEQPHDIIIGIPPALGSLCSQGEIGSGQFYGSIDELRVYSRELTGSDIRILYS